MLETVYLQELPSETVLASAHAFAAQGGRRAPPFFAGRSEERAELIELANQIVLEGLHHARDSVTTVITGVVGSGKTSLLRRVARELHESNQNIIPVEVQSNSLESPMTFASSFLRSIGVDVTKELTKRNARNASIDAKVYKHNFKWGTRPDLLMMECLSQGGCVWDSLKLILEPTEDYLFVLLIDESQGLPVSNPFAMNSVKDLLGCTTGINIIPIFAGLTNTVTHLENIDGMTRLGRESIRLSALSKDECVECVQQTLVVQNLAGCLGHEVCDDLAELFAVMSEGWPVQLNSYIAGLNRSLVRTVRSGSRELQLSELLDDANTRRISYYNARSGKRDRGSVREVALVVSVMLQEGLAIKHDELEAKLSRPDSASIIERATVTGLLEPVVVDDDMGFEDHYQIPIPSMRTYLELGLNEQRFREHLEVKAHEQLRSM